MVLVNLEESVLLEWFILLFPSFFTGKYIVENVTFKVCGFHLLEGRYCQAHYFQIIQPPTTHPTTWNSSEIAGNWFNLLYNIIRTAQGNLKTVFKKLLSSFGVPKIRMIEIKIEWLNWSRANWSRSNWIRPNWSLLK